MTRVPAAILVLGARVLPSGRASTALMRRIEAGAEAARRWPGAKVVACGGRAWNGLVEADVMARALVSIGVEPARIERDRLSFNTRENLVEGAQRCFSRASPGLLAVVTCDWHLPRALSIARGLGLEAMGVPARAPRGPLLSDAMRDVRERVVLFFDRMTLRLSRSP